MPARRDKTDSSARRDGARTPLIAHVIYRLDVGGLENGLVNLINHMPADRFRHAVVCLTSATDFGRRIARSDVAVYCLNKPPGNSMRTQLRLWALLRSLRPDIVHTRNLAALECTFAAALAGCRVRLHGEHGRDAEDPDGTNVRRQRIRRLFRPLVHRYVAVSRDLASYLRDRIRVPGARISHICNGVDTALFHPREVPEDISNRRPHFVIGTVGRMEAVKDPLNLVQAFLMLLRMMPEHRSRLRLAMAGDGALRDEALAMLTAADAQDAAWLPGRCEDVPQFLRHLDLFVLPSLGEGISNTILEAMASGLPVVGTRVGGTPELLEDGVNGLLVPAGDPKALADAMAQYVRDSEMALRHGAAARRAAEQRFGLQAMVASYVALYEGSLGVRHSSSRTTGNDRKADATCAG